MKHTFALAIALLFATSLAVAAESVSEGSETNMLSNHDTESAAADAGDTGSGMAARRAAILPIARSVKPGDLPLAMIDAVIMQESGYRTEVRGARGEVGLMQILPATARNVARDHGMPSIAGMSNAELIRFLSEPRNNLRIGLSYLYWCYNRADRDIGATIGCYNAGPGNMWRWESISVTRKYVRNVRQHMARSGFAGS